MAEEATVDAYCVDFCKDKLNVLGVDVDAAWRPKVSARGKQMPIKIVTPLAIDTGSTCCGNEADVACGAWKRRWRLSRCV